MSVVDEDTELRDLLVQTLDKNGVLGKIKAELRASIFLALEAQDQVKNPSSLANPKLQRFLSKPEGQTCVELIHEFFDFFRLDYSSAVFSPESNTTSSYKSSATLLQKLNLKQDENSTGIPVLASLLKEQVSISPALQVTPSSAQLENARRLFSANLERGSEILSATAATHALSALCPKFPLFLIERFVNEEAKPISSNISMPSFLSMYEKLFHFCYSVISESTQNGSSFNRQEAKKPTEYSENPEDNFLRHNTALSEKKTDPIRSTSMSSPDETPTSTYGHFFDDDYYSKPKDLPVKLTDSKPSHTTNLPPLHDSTKPNLSEISEKVDWSSKDKSGVSDKRQQSYEDDFNTTSHASVTEDLQGDSLLLSSTQSSMGELTEDRTISESDVRADYLEEIKK